MFVYVNLSSAKFWNGKFIKNWNEIIEISMKQYNPFYICSNNTSQTYSKLCNDYQLMIALLDRMWGLQIIAITLGICDKPLVW